jgi:hypothetical protein
MVWFTNCKVHIGEMPPMERKANACDTMATAARRTAVRAASAAFYGRRVPSPNRGQSPLPFRNGERQTLNGAILPALHLPGDPSQLWRV